MSRCFPYPPPGYFRNGAAHEALIESIKLQKETDKAKADRKKEKRAKKEKKEKKKEEKEKRKTDEKLKLQKNQNQDSQKLQKEAGFTQAQINGTKPSTELLEKSDLTQENGQPIKPCYSSDSTQNSNKRRRDKDDDGDLLPDDSPGHGNHIKIRLSKKHKGSDPSNSAEDARSNRSTGVPETSGRENNAVQGIPLTQTKSNTHFERVNGIHLGSSAKPTLPSGPRKSDVDARKSTTQQQIARFVRPVLPQSHLKHEAPTSSDVSRNIGAQGLINSARHHQQGTSTSKSVPIPTGKRPVSEFTASSNSRPARVEKNEVGKRPVGEIPVPSNSRPAKLETNEIGKRPIGEITVPSNSRPAKLEKNEIGKRPISEITVPSNSGAGKHEKNEIAAGKRPISEIPVPSNSGAGKHEKNEITTGKRPIGEITVLRPTKLEKNEEPKKKGPTRAEKKMMKKQAKYEKLIGGWVPMAFLPPVEEDEDWLSRSVKPASSSTSRGQVESCHELAASSLWQPRARLLAEADIYALPYTVPF